MTDMNDVLEVQGLDNGEGVRGVMVHVVTTVDLGGATVAATVVRDDTEALLHEEQHLRIPVIGGQGPSVVEHDGLCVLWAPVLEKDLCSVLRCHGVHGVSFVELVEVRPRWDGLGCRIGNSWQGSRCDQRDTGLYELASGSAGDSRTNDYVIFHFQSFPR